MFDLFVIVLIALLVLSFVMSVRAAQKRRAELNAFAAANGWTYIERDDSLTNRWRGQPFSRHRDKATDVFRGNIGPSNMPFVAFTYSYTEKYTDSRGNRKTRTYHHEVRVIQLPQALPNLQVTFEGETSRIAKFFGNRGIDFESDDFNRTFRIQSDDPRFAYGVIHPQFMEWMLGPGRELVPWRIDNTALITFDGGELDPGRFPHKLKVMATLVHQIPQHVWDDFGR